MNAPKNLTRARQELEGRLHAGARGVDTMDDEQVLAFHFALMGGRKDGPH
jgi:hypothetical protein